MAPVPITIACSDNDRTRPVLSGRVGVEGCEATCITMEPAEIFHRAFRYEEWDVAELSFSSYLRTVAAGTAGYVAIPAFVSRVFRHSGIYIRTDRGIRAPADLKGRLVGVPEYQMTAAVWMRAMLQDEYGVRPADMRWRTGGQEQPGREERTPLSAISGLDLQPIAQGKALSPMLEAGEIDALFAARPPSSFLRGAAGVGRLFPDYRAAEQAWYRKTGLFPIMHLIGVRRSLAEKYPWLPSSVYKAFREAKELAMRRLVDLTVLTVALPWMEAETRQTIELMGSDFWRYGVAENAGEIEAMIRCAHEQGLTGRRLEAGELFARTTFDVSRT